MFQQNPIKTFLDLFLSRLTIKDKNQYDMCICSRKYGSYSNNFFSEHARNELAKQLPLKMQKWVEKIIKNIIEMELGQKEATVIFSKGKIYTMNDKQPVVEAIAISGKRILFTGSEEEAMKLKTPQTTIIDLGGKTMLPGFIDPHVHLVFASMQDWVDLGPFVNSNMAQVKSKLIEAIKNHKDPNVILTCQLFDPKIIPGEKHDFDFSRKGLDSLTQTVPIFIYEDNGHVAHVNSAALNLVKINDSTPDPPHGRFIRDQNGVLTGEVQQTALAFFKNKFPHITKQQYINHAKKLLQKCASKGCTTLHDAGIGSADPDADLSIIYEIAGENSPVRLSGFLVSNYWKKWQELKMVPEYKEVNLRIHGMKCWSDGNTQAYFRDLSVDQVKF